MAFGSVFPGITLYHNFGFIAGPCSLIAKKIFLIIIIVCLIEKRDSELYRGFLCLSITTNNNTAFHAAIHHHNKMITVFVFSC